MPGTPLISLDAVERRFASGTVALRGATLSVQAGEFVSLLGPSGCGKSTVLRLVAGLDRPTAGTVDSPAWREPRDARTAFVFQDPTLLPWARTFDNVWLPLRLAGVSRAVAAPRVNERLQAMGIADAAQAFPAQLSGGMKMRAAIARALVTEPDVLLMDEPFGALDEITRQRLNADLLAGWAARRVAVMFVTHSVVEAAYLSQRVLVMGARPGRVVDEVRIDAPFPRPPGFRTSVAFAEVCARLSSALETAMAEPAA